MTVTKGLDVGWALSLLKEFIQLTKLRPSDVGYAFIQGDPNDVIQRAHVVEMILDRALPRWRTEIPADKRKQWQQHREASLRAIVQLEQAEDLSQRLGDSAPELSASSMHPWIWEAARSLWQSAHYRQAVGQAAVKVNAEAQNKAGTRKYGEKELFDILFSGDRVPKPGMPRFILPEDDGGKTADSFRRGVKAFAEGCYAAIRNPSSHDLQDDLEKDAALEQLAAFSILARWIEQSRVELAR